MDIIDESYTVLRTGLLVRNVPHEECESIGGHTAKLIHDSQIFPAEERGVNRDEMAIVLVGHDSFVETGSKGWDIPPPALCGISREEKERHELVCLDENITRMGQGAEPLRQSWFDYHCGRTPSGRMGKQLDKVRAALEARQAGLSEHVVRSEFVAGARSQIQDTFLKSVLDKWEGTADSKTDTEEVYRQLLGSYDDFKTQRVLVAAVSRRPERYLAAFGAS